MNVYLVEIGSSKLTVVKALKELFDLGLKEAKDLTKSAPCVIAENVDIVTAKKIKKDIEEAGAKIELRLS